jgi:hypothetical protein
MVYLMKVIRLLCIWWRLLGYCVSDEGYCVSDEGYYVSDEGYCVSDEGY